MKILYVNNQFRLGGAETVLSQLRRHFPNSGLALADGKFFPDDCIPLYPRFLARYYHSRLLPLIRVLAPREKRTDRAFRRLANRDFDLVHVHNFHGRYASIESLAAVASAKPLVWTFHALWGVTGGCDHPRECTRFQEACGSCPQLNRWPLGAVDATEEELERKQRRLSPLPLHIIAPSRWIARQIAASKVGRHWSVTVIPNAVDSAFVEAINHQLQTGNCRGGGAPREGRRPVVLMVNRNFADEQKGFPIAREALLRISASDGAAPTSRAKVLLAGEHAEAAAGQLPGWECEPLGYLSDAPSLARAHSRADIFLFASPAENFPCAVLEAMAAHECVVATPSGGVVEQIDDGVHGLLADSISANALAEKLQLALRDEALRYRLAGAARRRVMEEFSEDLFVSRHRRLYEQILSREAKPQ